MNRSRLLVCVCLTLLTAFVRAQDVPFERDIEDATRMAGEARDFYAQIDVDYSRVNVLAKDDLAQAKDWCSQLATDWENVAAMFKGGKADEARELQAQTFKKASRRDRWRQRLDFRARQSDTALPEDWLPTEKQNAPAACTGALDAFVAARKASVDAFAAAAEAITPETTDTELVEIRAKATTAMSESWIAEWQYRWSRDLWELIENRALSPKVDQGITEMEKLQKSLVEVQRKRIELECEAQRLDQKRNELLQQTRVEFDAARRAKE